MTLSWAAPPTGHHQGVTDASECTVFQLGIANITNHQIIHSEGNRLLFEFVRNALGGFFHPHGHIRAIGKLHHERLGLQVVTDVGATRLWWMSGSGNVETQIVDWIRHGREWLGLR